MQALARIAREQPWCIVMPKANCTMHLTISESHVAGVDPSRVASILRDVAMCLHNIHNRGIVHGDIKPRCAVCGFSSAEPGTPDVIAARLFSSLSTIVAMPLRACYPTTLCSNALNMHRNIAQVSAGWLLIGKHCICFHPRDVLLV